MTTTMRQTSRYIAALSALLTLVACSTTKGLQDDEVLYTGIKNVKVEDKKGTFAESVALTEVDAALAYAPNNSFMGSSTVRFPLPIGLWIYNGFVNNQTSPLTKWMFKAFSTTPVTLTMVNPETRVQVATNTLQNYGYFQGRVTYDILTQSNPKKAKIAYNVKLGEPYLLDSIRYAFPQPTDSVVTATMAQSYIGQDKQFSVVDLQAEKDRISAELRNNGFYYYRPDYINYYADSMMVPQRVKLLVMQDPDTPERAMHKWYIGNISAYIQGREPGQDSRSRRRQAEYTDSTEMRGVKCGQAARPRYPLVWCSATSASGAGKSSRRKK